MLARSFAGVLAAGFLLTLTSPAPAGAADGRRGNMKTATYSVADLVIPVNQPTRKEVKTQEETLMRLIVSTVAPRTWSGAGGPGSIDYFPLTMTLVVNQTPDVQEQVADLLESLRRLQDNEVTVEVRFLTVSSEAMEQLGITEKEGAAPGMAVLDDTQVQLLLERLQGDRRTSVMQMPKLTMFNGQQAMVDLTEKQTFVVGVDFEDKGGKQVPQPRTRTVATGLQVSVLPTLSPDRSTVTMQLGIHVGRADAELAPGKGTPWSKKVLKTNEAPDEPRFSTLEVEKTLRLKDGTSALLSGWTQQREVRNKVCPPVISRIPYLNRVFSTVSYGRETEHTLVLVTPRVVARAEAEEKLPMPTAEECPRPGRIVRAAEPQAEIRRVRHEERKTDVMYVNKHSFELSYQLDNVGPSRVKSVEVWWTHGDGKWARYPDEVRPGGPVPITVQADGRYGFTLVPRSGAGLCGRRPAEGDEPSVWVEVDTRAPQMELYAPDLTGLQSGQETIGLSWKAEDANLRPDSVCLYWSEAPDGPWHLFGRDLKARDRFECSCKTLPYRFYLRATASDLAGNVVTVTSPEAVNVDLRVPTVRDVKVNVRK